MSQEQPEQLNRLDLGHKLELEKQLMVQMLGEGGLDNSQQLVWIDRYAKEVSEIINEDSALGAEIREMALSERYSRAVEIIIAELKKHRLSEAA